MTEQQGIGRVAVHTGTVMLLQLLPASLLAQTYHQLSEARNEQCNPVIATTPP